MGIINDNSLALTLDALNEVFFLEKPLSISEKQQVAHWLAGRQGKPGSYFGMFALTEDDFNHDIRLFTGEKIPSKAAAKHILGEETCRALLQLDIPDVEVTQALQRATESMMERLSPATGYY